MHDVARSGWRALAVSALLFASATASRAADVVLENLRFQLGGMTYAAPRAEFRGTPHDRAELTALFDPNAAEPLAARIARLQAAEIVLPEILSEFTTPQGPQVTRYRGIVFTQVGGGRIASASAAGGSIDANGPEGKSQGSFGRLALQELDLGLTVAFFTEKATGPAELKRLYGAASVEDLQLTDPSGATTRVGRLFGRDFAARPTAEGWLGTVQVMGQNPDLKAAPPAERARVTAAMADLFGAFQIGALEAIDITFAGKAAEDGKGRIARIAFQGATGSRAAELTLDGFEASSSDTRVQFRSLAFSGLSLQPVLDGLRDFGAAGPDAMSPATMRRFIPLVGATRLTALDVDVPSGAKRLAGLAGLEQPTVRVSVAQFEVLAEKPIEGIPTELRVGLRNLTFPIPANPEDDSLKQLAELGYERVDGSLTTHLGWNEAGQELVIREISVDGAGMGSAVLRGIVGNVTRDVFSPDSAVATVAAVAATGKALELTLENRGLFERVIAREARRQKRNGEDIRREYGMAAAVGIPAILGNSQGAKTLAQAVARFVAKPGRLIVRARAKAAGGYGLADFTAGSDPASVIEALEITAVAE